ncbi:MAG: hypothetical protein ACYDCN_14630 [Bacteroidia bacterium]
MKNQILISLFIIGFISCTKKESATAIKPAVPKQIPIIGRFNFHTSDVTGGLTNSYPGNTLIIKFYQNNNVVYSVRTTNTTFTINNFKDGSYIFEITDSLGLYSYTRDSLVSKNGIASFGQNQTGIDWSKGYNLDIGDIQIKPTFTLLSYTAKDTGNAIYIKVNVGGSNINGAVIFYFYRNNKVSSNNLFNYAPLYILSSAHNVSSTQPSASDIFNDVNALEQGTSLHSGDSVYFAVYASGGNLFESFDYLAPKDSLGWGQYTCIGTQKLVIPYKLH